MTSELGIRVLRTHHNQELVVSRGFTSGRGNICIWVEEPNGCWPLVLNTDRDAVQLAEMLLDAVLYPPT